MLQFEPLSYRVDRKRFKSPPPRWDSKRGVPGTKAALGILYMYRIDDSNVWECVLKFRSAN